MQIQENVSLKPYNTFGINANAKYFAALADTRALEELTSTTNYKQQTTNLLILGGGSNILLTTDVDGLVLKNEIKGIEVVKEDDKHVYIKAGAGENWHSF